ncbi:MAG: hypothetical protein KF716_11065 [Anaerolineae bacterium]|nr:hypothetical protein [Anaerolineae bacterium]
MSYRRMLPISSQLQSAQAVDSRHAATSAAPLEMNSHTNDPALSSQWDHLWDHFRLLRLERQLFLARACPVLPARSRTIAGIICRTKRAD